MNNERGTKKFIGYEYREIIIENDMEPIYVDCYKSFGWNIESITPIDVKTGTQNKVSMKFKRDRKIFNKVELTRLQRHFDSCVREIQSIEKSKFSSATIKAFTVGLIGTAFIAGATFAFLSDRFIFCIILAIPGFIGWVVPYFLFKSTYSKKEIEITPLIEDKYDEIYEICQKATNLLG